MKLFDRFDKVYCINLKKRTDRLQHFNEQVNKYDLGSFEVFEAIDGNILPPHPTLKQGELGIINSVIEILQLAIKNNFNNILIIEDDCVFNDNILIIDDYFNNLPKDWDMIYFGGNHNLHMGVKPPVQINDKIVKLHYTFAAHCIGIKNNMFNTILIELKKQKHQSDVVFQKLQSTYNVYCFFPLVASQLPGFSDIQNKNVNYNKIIV